MGLYDDLTACREVARKNHDSPTLDSVQNVISAVKNEQINQGKILSDDEIQIIIARQVKQLKDALLDFVKANRSDLIDKTNIEIKLLESFLPQQLTDEEITTIARQVVLGLGTLTEKDLGRALGAVMPMVKGRADGTRVRAIVGQLISGLQPSGS
ncbi:MAG: hypothetical protein A2821_04135 [Candidatus Magasanikbacteria bacterium RIFCSPHIGHO2_01_FULL_41_23]|uniref:Glutamyl-tRNA amidotransferase n=1 Tax=Candidatus Magasanikbacteria bacterium RIFCSPLOWO2_01_FULL_40_15 TaxID=1798686 RepID=A0A1F6N2V9_9BACT|nr:MAG: hypothetical protein A2821_04135 [Candidatus Magasanikbacteria bacterium RIFCSPHIGHO2_01_FULL_41_23]OGH67235.1 MAG: hypothetical protein A3C66_00635 [Candidatus Magasanikbacteria bacterium RIFCSPHIGHO2_02_FULL_41_35]OGH74810.1 MAG: hypothetical protein A3F22_01550 [Candidatus Magasanikbacteria bacterium RIFCSPHIGHO2_12_FULL_41_16]OGH78078.1 MAG: hypothetical protein A2983_02040 [Candidatus Magasanikbacteria bacterium RIFCSPLOWO2_01_FULL_40_15]